MEESLKDLVARCQAGLGSQDFERLFDQIEGPLFYYIRALGADEVEEVLQITLFKIYQNIHDIDPFKHNVLFWACTIARNETIDMYRKKVRRNALYMSFAEAQELAKSSGADQALKEERLQWVLTSLKSISARCFQLVSMRFLGEMTWEEVADLFHEEKSTVREATKSCLEKVKKKIKGFANAGPFQ